MVDIQDPGNSYMKKFRILAISGYKSRMLVSVLGVDHETSPFLAVKVSYKGHSKK